MVDVIIESFVKCRVHKVSKDWQDVGPKEGMNATVYHSNRDGTEISIWKFNIAEPIVLIFVEGAEPIVGGNFVKYRDNEIARQDDTSKSTRGTA